MTDSIEEGQLFIGRCVGGPLDGQTYAIRKPAGFVLADKSTAQGWYYERVGDEFRLRDAQPVRLRPADAIGLAQGPDYDVIAPPEDPTGPVVGTLAAANPNPTRITAEIWRFWGQFDALEPSVQMGGIYADKPGYHNYRNDLPTSDYSRRDVAADREGPADKASAIDLTMSNAAMKKYTTRLDAAARARDERLYLSGVPVIREFIGTKDNRSVYCYVLTGGRPLGVGADAGPDPGRDSSHLWHLHISIIRRYVGNRDAYDRLMSVLRGESLAAWKARTQPKPPAQSEEDDDMSQQVIPLPNGFAYDENVKLISNEFVRSIPVEPAGYANNGVFGKKRLYVSFGCDHTDGQTVKVRVAIYDGTGWNVSMHEISAGPRTPINAPLAKNNSAYNITVGRVKKAATDGQDQADIPLSMLVTVA